jgi:hypothetical protein
MPQASKERTAMPQTLIRKQGLERGMKIKIEEGRRKRVEREKKKRGMKD